MNLLTNLIDKSDLPFQHPETREYPFWMVVNDAVEGQLMVLVLETTPDKDNCKGLEIISTEAWQARTLEIVAETGVLPDDESYETHCEIQSHYALVEIAFEIFNECYGVADNVP